ncbi:protein of unknown function [Taphrina deformans PYCC 5710]|uniref:Uncharacterized protein n=1 Tax=Taphrina deformans (strain PYCC 5710 / ATCC 11124 / CBS 356.35 / IMI 108563 / JCM 9778 / NBRC 8474) TaxID=1097556 RepID=R4XFN4_TAPDE|nr:protein of unknown function [Taphrina deformans PYCC 5710]|eukprot:CCG84661.1 protein of unknown function [Taphrina deformans PYCC 5710]
MRTLLLLNTTQRKLQFEEHLLDSSKPLKALQLSRVAQRLNDHLHNEQAVQIRTPIFRHTDFRNLGTTTTVVEEEEEEVEDDTMTDNHEDDAVLFEMQHAVAIDETELTDDIELLAAESYQSNVSDPIRRSYSEISGQSGTVLHKVCEVDEEDLTSEDLGEVDITETELDDMPTLSRQISAVSIPALYHSDGDESDDELHPDNFYDCESAVQRFLNTHHKIPSHPATGLFDKAHSVGDKGSASPICF